MAVHKAPGPALSHLRNLEKYGLPVKKTLKLENANQPLKMMNIFLCNIQPRCKTKI